MSKEFPQGIHVSEAEPKWVLAKLGFNVKKFTEWLKKQENKRGWVNIDIKKSKKGNLYADLNNYKKDDDLDEIAEEMNEDIPF